MKRQTIYVLGYPKSGTTWLARLLGDALNSPVGAIRPQGDGKAIATEGQDRPGSYYIRQGHAVPVENGDTLTPGRHEFAYKHLRDERVVIMIRDPRDIAVSAAHHWDRDITTALHCMGKGLWPMPHGGGWCEWVKKWVDVPNWMSGRMQPGFARYEKLTTEPYLHLFTVMDIAANGDFCRNRLQRAIARQSFTARRAWTEQHGDSLNYGKDFQLRFLRKGIVGDWENHFTVEHRILAERYFGETMRELGYTESEEWVNQ